MHFEGDGRLISQALTNVLKNAGEDRPVGSLIGITLFGEHLMIGGGRGPWIGLSLLAIIAGIFILCRDTELASNFGTEAAPVRVAPAETG